MSNREDYEAKLDVLIDIKKKDIKTPHHTPVDAYIQEASDLYHWAKQDKNALVDAGLDWEWVDDLPARFGALVEAQARWNREKNTMSEALLSWKKESTEAYRLRITLRDHFRFAFRKHPNVKKKIRPMQKGHAGLIQELNDLAVLGHNQKELLQSINFDFTLLDRAAELSKELAALLPNAVNYSPAYKEAKTIRDAAYTHLKEAVDEIREHGQFVFRDQKERFIGYRSHHIRRLNVKLKKNIPENDGVDSELAESPESSQQQPDNSWENWQSKPPQFDASVD